VPSISASPPRIRDLVDDVLTGPSRSLLSTLTTPVQAIGVEVCRLIQ
jgi:hypothetical protein